MRIAVMDIGKHRLIIPRLLIFPAGMLRIQISPVEIDLFPGNNCRSLDLDAMSCSSKVLLTPWSELLFQTERLTVPLSQTFL
jgi:hypothetical protein